MLRYGCLFFISWFTTTAVLAQTGRLIRFSTSYSMFPDTARSKGHFYNGNYYDAATHYSDSAVLIYVPGHFTPQKKINIVYWFHGWGNNIDSACRQFQLLEQFEASGRNAVFVFPEGPKDAPDSYGGKLEQPVFFQLLTKEVVEKLFENSIIKLKNNFQINDYAITLAGHSGAYRVISRIINYSPVTEVILFDAMYGGNDAYLQWLSRPEHRFINIYTKDGGTYDNSQYIMHQLSDSLKVPFISIEEEALGETVLRNNQKLFIFSKSGHSEVITHHHNWELFLRNTPTGK